MLGRLRCMIRKNLPWAPSSFLTLSVPRTWVRLDPEDTSLVSWAEMISPELKECWEGPKLFFPKNQPLT